MNVPQVFAKPPRFIPRRFMPQVEESDYPALRLFLAAHGVSVEASSVDPETLRFHQRASITHPIGSVNASKPVLVSSERFILDGNHRALWHRLRGDYCPILRLNCSFETAIALLFAFPKTTTTTGRN